MYEAFYGLSEKPFNLTPDPRFLFLSEKHKEAFAHLLYGIKNRTGFVMVSGEIGTGKTTICRSLLNQLDPDTEVAFIFNPCLSPEELLRNINEDFGIASRADSIKDLIDELNLYLLERNRDGKNCVLVIDEAQNLSTSVLEQIRLLSNLETETQKLLQIVLIGQPELAQHLQLPELRQLNQRITARYHLNPLDAEETLQYIAFRLRVAGGRKKVHFTRGAIRAVYRHSGGTPRVINALCDRALLIGYTKETHDITASIVRQAAKEIRGEVIRTKWSTGTVLRRFLPNPSAIVTAAVILILVMFFAPLREWYAPSPDLQTASPAVNVQPSDRPLPSALNQASATVQTPKAQRRVAPGQEMIREPAPVLGADKTVALTPVARVSALAPAAARNAAVSGMLRAWNRALIGGYPDSDAPVHLAQFAEANGLTAEILTPMLADLLAIGLPALIQVKGAGQPIWVALLGVERDAMRVTTYGNESVVVSHADLKDAYLNQAVIFWQGPPDAPVLRTGMNGADVTGLQEALQALDRLTDPASGEYDPKTLRAVVRLQAETGLIIDGVVGRQVRMVLSSWLSDDGVPSLFQPGDPRRIAAKRKGEPTPGAGAVAKPAATPSPVDNPLPAIFMDVPEEYTGIGLPPDLLKISVEDLPPPHSEPPAPPATDAPEATPPAASNTPTMDGAPARPTTSNTQTMDGVPAPPNADRKQS